MRSFYVKNVYGSRLSIFDHAEVKVQEERKREPTPIKSKNLIVREKKEADENFRMTEIEYKLKVADLEQKNQEKNQMLEKLKRESKTHEGKLEELKKVKEENKREIEKLIKQNKEKAIKIK